MELRLEPEVPEPWSPVLHGPKLHTHVRFVNITGHALFSLHSP